MPTPDPVYCRPEAHRFFVEQVRRLETERGLVLAAIAVSMHELDSVDPFEVDRQIDAIAEQVRRRVRGGDPKAVLAHAHEVMFDELGFTGNASDYYNPRNSYLPLVLRTRQGIPITLALLYKAVVERLGLEARGINAPGHFMVEVFPEGPSARGWIIDAFHGGRVLSREEAFGILDDLAGRKVERDPRLLPPATHEAWLHRVLQNLVVVFDRLGRRGEVGAMTELQAVLADRGGG